MKPGVTAETRTFSDCFVCLSQGIERMISPQVEKEQCDLAPKLLLNALQSSSQDHYLQAGCTRK